MLSRFARLGSALAVIAILASAAQAQDFFGWEGGLREDGAYASDCHDCEEERQVLLECKNGADHIDLLLQGLARDDGTEKETADVVIRIDGKELKYAGETRLWGLIGYFPVVKLDFKDPLIEDMSSGQTMEVEWKGGQMSIPLDGSRDAITTLLSGCG